MQISVLCRKAIVLAETTVLLVFGILGVSYSQVQLQLDENSYPEIEVQGLSSKK